MEYAFILALILGFVVLLMISGLRESELTMATGAARSASADWIAGSGSLRLASLETTQNGRSVNFTPVVFYWGGGRVRPLPAELKRFVVGVVRSAVSPPSALNGDCFSSVNYDYCVADAP